MTTQIGVIAFEVWNYAGLLLILSAPVVWFLRSRWVWLHAIGLTAHLVILLVVSKFAWVPPGWADGNVYAYLIRNYGDCIILLFDFFSISLKGGIFDLVPAIILVVFAVICGELSFRFTPIWLDTIPSAMARAVEHQAQGRPYCITLSGGRLARSIDDFSVENLMSGLGVEYHSAYAQLNVKSNGSWESGLWSFRSLDFIRLAPNSAQYFPVRCETTNETGIRSGSVPLPTEPKTPQ